MQGQAQQHQQQQSDSKLLDTKHTDQFLKFQQSLPSLRRHPRSLLGSPAGLSPPPSPPDLDTELAHIAPLFDFSLFDPERARGRNARLPVAVTSTLHSSSDRADDLVLQTLLGDATSFAASNASQLASATAEQQHLQSTLALQRIEQMAASAQEMLRVQGPSFPHSAPQYPNSFPSPPQNFPSDFSFKDRALASLLEQPNQLVTSMEHYEAAGSGRPGRSNGQQQPRFHSPSPGWLHKPVASRWPSDFGSSFNTLRSPPALINSQQQNLPTPGSLQVQHPPQLLLLGLCGMLWVPTSMHPTLSDYKATIWYTVFICQHTLARALHWQLSASSEPGSFGRIIGSWPVICMQSLLPWDFNRWGGFPTDVEQNVAHGFRLREQQQQQQQAQEAQQSPVLQLNPDQDLRHQVESQSAFAHQGNQPSHLHSFSFQQLRSHTSDPQSAYHQLGGPQGYMQQAGPASAAGLPTNQYNSPQSLTGDEAFLAYSRRLVRQELPIQEMMQEGNTGQTCWHHWPIRWPARPP